MAAEKTKSKEKKAKGEKKDKKSKKQSSGDGQAASSTAQATLLADEKSVDSKLSSLFAVPVSRVPNIVCIH